VIAELLLMKRVPKQFLDPTLRAGECVALFIAPLRQAQCWRLTFTVVLMVMVIVLSSFSFLGTTMFAKPTVAEIEEMGGLMHFPNDANFVL
jgi:hypothetical protein